MLQYLKFPVFQTQSYTRCICTFLFILLGVLILSLASKNGHFADFFCRLYDSALDCLVERVMCCKKGDQEEVKHGPIIYKDTKCRLFLKIDQERSLAACVYLSEAPDPLPPPLHTVWIQGRGGGGGRTSEKVRGAIIHRRGLKYCTNMTDCISSL